jgi:molybdopterin synthase catalytic subunit
MVTVLYFAAARERTGVPVEELDLGGQTVGALKSQLGTRHSRLAAILPQCRVAVNQDFMGDDDVVPDGAEVALIPPVAGGADAGPDARVRVLDTPLAVDPLLDAVAHESAGAQVVMIGCVRDHAEGQGVESLEYEAYVPMAEKVIAGIVDEVQAQWPGVRAAVHHRTGHLAIGDRAVVVATSAAHRQDAFDACQRIIDRLKEDAPIWKREHREGGVLWVGMGP